MLCSFSHLERPFLLQKHRVYPWTSCPSGVRSVLFMSWTDASSVRQIQFIDVPASLLAVAVMFARSLDNAMPCQRNNILDTKVTNQQKTGPTAAVGCRFSYSSSSTRSSTRVFFFFLMKGAGDDNSRRRKVNTLTQRVNLRIVFFILLSGTAVPVQLFIDCCISFESSYYSLRRWGGGAPLA